MREYHVLCLGAGVQSTTVALLRTFDVAIFADTQEEPDAVYWHLDWLIAQVNYPIWKRTLGKLGDDLIRGRDRRGRTYAVNENPATRFASIPAFTGDGINAANGMTRRQCSREYKTDVIIRAIREELVGLRPRQRWPKDVVLIQHFGISRDEAGRALRIRERIKEEGRGEARFPLLDLGWTRADCLRFLASRVPHPVPKSSCVFCPYHSDAYWLAMKRNDPKAWVRSVEIDEALRKPDSAASRHMEQRLYLHRSGKPLAEVNLNEHQYSLGFIRECEGKCGL